MVKYFSKDRLNSILKNDLILVKEDFVKIFDKKIDEIKKNKILFKVQNHQLIFLGPTKTQIGNAYSIDNILPIESNEAFQIANNLIELYIFQEQLKLRMKRGKKDEKGNLFLVDKKWMNDLKNKYSYDKLCNSIISIEKIKNIINKLEKTENAKHHILIDIIKEFNWDIFYDICNASVKENVNNYGLEYQNFNLNNINIRYADNFELIDINLINKLNIEEQLKNKIQKKVDLCYLEENKILIKYVNLDNKDIYIIGYINENNSFISEYYIESLDNNNNSRLQYQLKQKKINDIIQKGELSILIGQTDKKIANIHKIDIKPDKKEENNNENEKIGMKIIEALLELYFFNKKLKMQLNKDSQQLFDGKCFLINKEWLWKFKTLNLYEFIYKDIINLDNNISYENNIKQIFEKYKKNFNNIYTNNEFPFILMISNFWIWNIK